MGWAKFDDQFTDHPKVVAAGPWAELLAMRAVIYCARYETDGFVQKEQLPRLTLGITSPKKQVAELLRVGLWEEGVGGWRVHDFLHYHPSRAEKDEEREKARERMAKVREKKKHRSSGTSPDVRANTEGNSGRTSDYPDPARTPKGQSQEHPPGGNGEPFVKRLAEELRSEHGCALDRRESIGSAYQELLDQALEHLPADRHHATAMGVIASFVERLQGYGITKEARAHTASLVRNHPPSKVFAAFGEALHWGAGIDAKYADDPLSLSKYVAGVLSKKAGAA